MFGREGADSGEQTSFRVDAKSGDGVAPLDLWIIAGRSVVAV